MLKKNILKIAAIAMAATMAMPGAAFAANPTANGAGIDTADLQQFDTKTNTWVDSATESAESDDENGHKENTYDGKIHLFYDTTGGQWLDPSQDGPEGSETIAHDNGTYVVTIPTKIAYLNMNIGKVDTSDDYTVNVRGAIGQDKKVKLDAQTGNNLVNGDKSEITETTTQGKTEWSAAEVYGNLNTDGSLSGTNTTDTIKMTGEVTTAGVYEGSVVYTASLVDAAQSSSDNGYGPGTYIG